MSEKMDRQGARTAAELEQKYAYGKRFAEIMGIASDAQTAAKTAQESASKPAENLTPDEIFNILTNNGEEQGIYREDGKIYINASYLLSGIINADLIKSGTIDASLIKAGILQSADGSVAIDLLNNTVTVTTNIAGDQGKIVLSADGIDVYGWNENLGTYIRTLSLWGGVVRSGETTATAEIQTPYLNTGLLISSHKFVDIAPGSCPLLLKGKTVSWKDNGDGTFTLIGV